MNSRMSLLQLHSMLRVDDKISLKGFRSMVLCFREINLFFLFNNGYLRSILINFRLLLFNTVLLRILTILAVQIAIKTFKT